MILVPLTAEDEVPADVVRPNGEFQACRDCGALIVLVRIRPNAPVRGRRTRIPLERAYSPTASPVEPSHALDAGRWGCRPITAADPIAPHEYPALTHFATCPSRRRAVPGDDTP